MADLKCVAENCAYNKECLCTKGDIMVGGKHAKEIEDTCCESFIEVPWGVYNSYTETRLFPVQICEGITALIIAISVIIMAFRKDFRCRGTTMAWMWVMFGSTRVIWEFFRANEKLFWGLSELALWSIALAVAGVIWLVLDKKKGEKEI